jgi:transcriptional regulator of acetoin/glycerol metabolism
MAAGEGEGKRAAKVAAVLRPLGQGPLTRDQAVAAGNLLGIHWTTVYRLRRRFLADPVTSAMSASSRGPKPGGRKLEAAIDADLLDKPFFSERLAQIATQALLARGAYLDMRELGDAPERIEAQLVSRSTLMRDVRHKLLPLANNDVNVLIFGETGTGKELAARSLHEFGRRRVNPFVALNCAGLPETLFDREVFGHEAGSFTGAMSRRIGKAVIRTARQ